jgi:LSD1 subclass zinc finger protein
MSDTNFEPTAEAANTIKCKNCGSNLKFSPGQQQLSCEYCNTINLIEVEKTEVTESDYNAFLEKSTQTSEQQTISTVKCTSCGSATTLPPNVTSSNCPYCDTPLVIKNASTSQIIKPGYLLPFKFDRKNSQESFIKWAGSRWFAPSKLKDYARHSAEKLKGVYMPYWTYDSDTTTNYSGLRGTYYYVSQSYTDSNGNSQTRQVRHTQWFPASGFVHNVFDDILVCASHSLPQKLTDNLEPWDIKELLPYNDQFLAGFVTESYQTALKEGFEEAKKRMQPIIQTAVRNDIGGDTQQVTSTNTVYNNITFKHILLPLWISAYKYNNKVYRFTINARTGEVQGERPYSVAKIIFLIFGVLAVIFAIYVIVTGK